MDRSSSDQVGDCRSGSAIVEDNTSRKRALDEYLEGVDDVGSSESETERRESTKLCENESSTGENEELNVNSGDKLKWSYSAENIPKTYWLSKGFDDDYADAMTTFLGEMERWTHQLRRGRGDKFPETRIGPEGTILPEGTIAIGCSDEYESAVGILRHDDILLPHWKEFVDALALYLKHHRDHEIRYYLMITSFELRPQVINILAPILSIIDQFALGANSLSNRDVQAVFDTSHGIKNIIISQNNIGSEGIALIANFLASNPPLEYLLLDRTSLNDEDTIMLANALRTNSRLEQLVLNKDEGNNTSMNLEEIILHQLGDGHWLRYYSTHQA